MRTKYAYIHSLHPILPRKVFPQSELVNWTILAHERVQEMLGSPKSFERLKRFALSSDFVSKRYIECEDANENWDEHSIYPLTKNEPCGVDIKKRHEFYLDCTLSKMEAFYKTKPTPDHLIHVTCTGYVSPSAPQQYFSQKKHRPQITHAYHMGCYASLPAIRMAQAFSLAEEGKKIDIIHNEICSIHMNPSNHTPEQILVQTLFGDGHISYQVSSEKKGFKILTIKEKIIHESCEDMSWIPSAHGMFMTLSRNVPAKIEKNINLFMIEMAQASGLNLGDLIKHAVFAIHPGGPRIIDVIKMKLELRDEQIIESKKVLNERGNMSSATLPHVWHEISQNNYPAQTPIVSLAFGPGLTVFGGIFEVV